MAIFSKTLVAADFKELTIAKTFSTEPFPSAELGGVMKVKDEQGSLWNFKYKVKSKSKRVLSGHHWQQFLANNGAQPDHRIAIHPKDSWCNEADYKIEVIKTGS